VNRDTERHQQSIRWTERVIADTEGRLASARRAGYRNEYPAELQRQLAAHRNRLRELREGRPARTQKGRTR
jgi:hypothetical protein